jgi:hypothetical protein
MPLPTLDRTGFCCEVVGMGQNLFTAALNRIPRSKRRSPPLFLLTSVVNSKGFFSGPDPTFQNISNPDPPVSYISLYNGGAGNVGHKINIPHQIRLFKYSPALYLGLKLTIHVVKSQIHLVRQSR